MISIPTGAFWGAISDVLKAAADARTERDHAFVRIDWNDGRLIVSTYAITRGAVCTWTAADEGTSWGGDDEPVSVVLRTGQAKDILDTFKLSAGKALTPLSLDISYDRLVIHRAGTDEIDGKRVAYDTADEEPTGALEAFGNIGEPTSERVATATHKVAGALGAVSKRRGEPWTAVAHERAGRCTVGGEYVLYFTYPVEVKDTSYEEAANEAIGASA